MKAKILESLTISQRNEFENDVKSLIDQIIQTNNVQQNALHLVKSHIQLESKIFLYVTLEFVASPTGELTGKLNDIKEFKTKEEYLKSIEEENKFDDQWNTIK